MADYRRPGVYTQERLLSNANIQSATSVAMFVGAANRGPVNDPVFCETWSDYVLNFGGFEDVSTVDEEDVAYKVTSYLPHAVYSYYQNGGRPTWVQRAIGTDGGTVARFAVPNPVDVVVTNKAWASNVATLTLDDTGGAHTFEVGDRITVNISTDPENPDTFDGTFVINEVNGDDISYALDLSDSVENAFAVNEKQTLTIDATGGTFTLTYDGEETEDIAWNASAVAVRNALTALPNIGPEDVSVAKTSNVWTVTFKNELGGTNADLLVADDTNLTGGDAEVVVALVNSPGEGEPYSAATPAVGDVDPVVTGPDRDSIAFILETKDTGTWANFTFASGVDTDKGLAVKVEQDVEDDTLYTVSLYQDGTVVERFVNVTTLAEVPNGLNSLEDAINDDRVGSRFIKVVEYVPGCTPIDVDYPVAGASHEGTPANPTHHSYSGAFGRVLLDGEQAGENPSLPLEEDFLSAAQEAVSKVLSPVLINVPGYVDANGSYVASILRGTDFGDRNDVFVINDAAGPSLSGDTSASYMNAINSPASLGAATGDSRVAAYTPWIKIPNPKKAGNTILVPPGGAVAGTYSRIDSTEGVYRAPAGLIANIQNAVDVDVLYTDSQLGTLNDANINVIRPMAGVGMCIMGARTRKRFDVDRYVSGRRTLIYVTESLRQSTQFALFENNSERLWTQLKLSTEQFLRVLWENGGLRGGSPDEAFYVICDETINTPAVISRGEVHMEVGLALEYPAEFVVITISQYERGTNANNTTI